MIRGTKVRVITRGDFHCFEEGQIVTRTSDSFDVECEELKAFVGDDGLYQVLEESDYELL